MIKESFQIIKRLGATSVLFFLMLLTSLDAHHSIYVICIFSTIAFVVNKLYENWDNTAWGLFSFSLSYVIILMIQGEVDSGFNLISYLISPVCFYLYGIYVLNKLRSECLIETFVLLSIASFSTLLYASVLSDIAHNGFINPLRSIKILYVQKASDTHFAATFLGLNAGLGLFGLGYSLKNKKSTISIKNVLFISVSVLSLISVIHLVNRTGVFVFVITTALMVLYNAKKQFAKICIIILSVSVAILLLETFLDGYLASIIDAYTKRNEESGAEVSSGSGRFDRWIDALKYIFLYPLGWCQIAKTEYCHNLWLDIARACGFIPFLIFIVQTLSQGKKLRNQLKLKKHNDLTLMIYGLSIVFFCSSMVEPVIEGFPLFFYLYLFLWGLSNKFSIVDNQKKSNWRV